MRQFGYLFTAKTQYRKFETNIPKKGIALPRSQFPHSCACERFIDSHNRSAYSDAGKCVDRSWEINRLLTNECKNWGRGIPVLGTHKGYFRCRVPVD